MLHTHIHTQTHSPIQEDQKIHSIVQNKKEHNTVMAGVYDSLMCAEAILKATYELLRRGVKRKKMKRRIFG